MILPPPTNARVAVHAAKRSSGERGSPWWTDGAPDLNRSLVRNNPYTSWWDERDDGNQTADAPRDGRPGGAIRLSEFPHACSYGTWLASTLFPTA
jgi:hypothetical protein